MMDDPAHAWPQAPPDRTPTAGKRLVDTPELVVGEWSLCAAAWTDRHQHDEVNYVLEGALHVTSHDTTIVATPGVAVRAPASQLARYAAPAIARMVFIYGPSTDGHAASDTRYEELPRPE